MKGYFADRNFLALSGDASEARKTFEEKELVFGEILVNDKNGFVSCMFLLKCESLKEFGGGQMVYVNALTKCVWLQIELV